jgi:uroporphyrinogen-III synthase
MCAFLLINVQLDEDGWTYLQDIPIYSVGPATTKALNAVRTQDPPLQIFGEHTGNGEALAGFILDHYGKWYNDREVKPPLLFLVGEQRRDIIPKTLMNEELGSDRRIIVHETVMYGTGAMESFAHDFANLLSATESRPRRWVVVFSPTGARSMLQELNLLDNETGKVRSGPINTRRTFIATIGPTTRDYLKNTFDFDADVCAEKPSPEGILNGITQFTLL